MRVVFRVDASVWIGSGHVVRCATLGRKLRESGAEVHYLCRAMPGDRIAGLVRDGFEVHTLAPVDGPCGPNQAGGPCHESWLGLPLESEVKDATDVLARLGGIDWIVVDHYGLDSRWESSVRPYTRSTLVIDDLADRLHDCDLLVDQNLYEDQLVRYLGKVPKGSRTMLGPRYALLQDGYAAERVSTPLRTGPVRRIMVFFGAVDSANCSALAVRAFRDLERTDIELDVVIGDAYAHKAELRAQANGAGNIRFHEGLPSLAPLMASADLALGAAGTTTWERCCLGLPSLVVTLAKNQETSSRHLDRIGLIRLVGRASDLDVSHFRGALSEVIASGVDAVWSRRCRDAVDGLGASRVAEALLASGRI